MAAPGPIGGYLGLELNIDREDRFGAAHAYQSARAAYLALLREGRPDSVWMPWFICDSMVEPLRMSGINVKRYRLTPSLSVETSLTVGPRDWVLYVNYFGLCDAQVDELLHQVPSQQLIVDNAQAFYAPPRDCLANIYSPRKFFGVPDGGYLVSEIGLPQPVNVDDGSVARSSHLLARIARGPESGYASFLANENSLSNQEPMQMSRLTAAMLRAIDYEAANRRRCENFTQIHASLGSSNTLDIRLPRGGVPLCYPYRINLPGLRSKLIAARIYVPTYWPELARDQGDLPPLEQSLAHEILPLPCDQRYVASDMARMLDVITLARGEL